MSHIDSVHKVDGELVLGVNRKVPGQLLASYSRMDPADKMRARSMSIQRHLSCCESHSQDKYDTF